VNENPLAGKGEIRLKQKGLVWAKTFSSFWHMKTDTFKSRTSGPKFFVLT